MSLVPGRLEFFFPVVARSLAPMVAMVASSLVGCVIQENDVSQFMDSGRLDANVGAASDAMDATPLGETSLSETTGDAPPATDTRGDASASDATTAPETPAPCPYVLCEDFERGTAPSGWTVEESGGKATVQSARVAHGKYAAQFHLDVGGRHARFLDKGARPALEGHLCGRVYLYFDALPDPHSVFFTSGPADGSHYEVGSYSGGYQLTWWKPGAEKPTGGGALPKGKWWCMEFEINDAPSAITAWTDGATGAELSSIGTGLVGPMLERTIGFQTYASTTTAYDIYADDLALDTKRINCL